MWTIPAVAACVEPERATASGRNVRSMKSFDALFSELKDKATRKDPRSGTVRQLEKGVHAIGKKVIEEACEVWMAAEHEGRERTAEEISQLLYHVQVMMIACDLELEDVYRHL